MRWVIGDIHGMLRPLDALLNAVQKRDPAARFIFAGDYVNRGPDVPGVIERLLAVSHATFLRGNHDDIFDLILNGKCYLCNAESSDPVAAFQWFMQHGLDDTLMAYGVDYAELDFLEQHPDAGKLSEAVKVVPEHHRQFFRSLRVVAEYDEFFVAHAFWDPDEPDSSPDLAARLAADPRLRQQLLWGRYTEAQIQRKKRWKRTGFFGHTPVVNYRKDDFTPVYGPQLVLLDTGVALGANGRLTAVCADSGEVIQTDRAGTVIGAA
jgi:serine/threonine protein phosphatase 1